ncbi:MULTISPECIES: SDR family oxidoreductase [Cellulophaga]|uniref:NADP-dependent 3-hydroxy acid dehydrogenase YdfG n=1 Tax=Cellulophaga baltica TaxID=76594 RepID=A0A1G7GDQ2_9FLAO|nr:MULTISPECIES: SDR family oxidoreductase [Cellulophaga]KGK30871.1 oxidoreductase [Cellulophaga sp. E6(2014)]MBA6315738.1 SDR family oxidoreductase [Cellulophaga baltica]WFO16545.1 SDR family oxidoreductase [Cellulophaga baltica 4]SDE86215.1 NADP-dependent 3-hydroxy acid dehydrogenase YdfG [Cellulophaga baltica]
MKIENSILIITGASSGIGKATAHKLAENGAKVVLMARSEDELNDLKTEIEKNGGEALVVTGDVTKMEDFENVVTKTKEKFGTVNGLINNAGLMPLSFVEKLKTDEWDKMVDVNIKGVLNGVAAVLPELKANKGGNIINISSMAAHRYFPGGAVYCATKAAVKMFSEGLRQELAPKYGINITSIEPGAVATNLTSTITDDDIKEMMKEMFEMETLEAEDIANAIYYALTQPDRVNINDVYIVPSEQK